jgi:dTDP-4-amino-4,6-dideoxygalactose transaminase
MLGYNFRMGEIEAAIASEQLKKLGKNIAGRQHAVEHFNAGLSQLKGLKTPKVSPGNTHVYYIYGMICDFAALGVTRARVVEALRAEGVPGLVSGYQNIHLVPMFRNRIAYGTKGFPWNSPYAARDISYAPGLCPSPRGCTTRPSSASTSA